VQLGLVQESIKHLIVLGVARILPVFQYSNVYRPCPALSNLAKSRDIQKRAVLKCSKSPLQLAHVSDIFRFYAGMNHGATLGESCVRFNPAAVNINEKRAVLFGLLEGLIRRVNKVSSKNF
jgi:nitrogen permease regulator 2-like protein